MIDALRYAYQRAADESTDTSTKVGAVLIDPINNHIVAWGVNSFTNPDQLRDPRNRERPRKYKVTEHAERASIFKAARNGICTDGLLMVSTWACCPDCARAIVLAGILAVYAHKKTYDMTPETWMPEIELGIEILKGSGVQYNLIDADVGGVEGLFNGEIWYP